jgi:hypothetical protein
MKLRIKGNSLRIRLTRPEVEKLSNTGRLEEETFFVDDKFVYALQAIDEGNELAAAIAHNKITMFVPKHLLKDWPKNNVVGFNANMPLANNNSLSLLLEKDFVCLDETSEDQRDNYENPNKIC